MFKDVLGENKSRFERIELLLETLQTPQSSAHGDRFHIQTGTEAARPTFDLIVSQSEICPSHGTGVLLRRLFEKNGPLIHLRSETSFGGTSLGNVQLELKHSILSRLESFMTVAKVLRPHHVKRILCVPLNSDDIITAVAAYELFKAPLCLYLMDDGNIHQPSISDELMKEILDKAHLRLAIGPEMRDAYEQKFGQKIWVVPPVVPAAYIGKVKAPSQSAANNCVLVGNIWSAGWLAELRRAARRSGIIIHWYGNSARHIPPAEEAEWARDGIHARGFVEEQQLLNCLQEYSFAIVPVGSSNSRDTHQWQAELSIPSRIPFLMAVANIPIMVLSAKENPAANFVRRFGIGEVCDFEPKNIRATVTEISSPQAQQKYRANAARVAEAFSAGGVGDWIWRSLELGMPCDEKFESLFKGNQAS